MVRTPERFKDPEGYPKNGTFGQLLTWHLDEWGTTPTCGTSKPTTIWKRERFAELVHSHKKNDLSDLGVRKIRYWTGGKVPSVQDREIVERIYLFLFGANPKLPHLQRWKRDLENALTKARKKKKAERAKSHSSPISRVIPAQPVLRPIAPVDALQQRLVSEARDKVDAIIDQLAPSFVGRSADLAKIDDFVNARMVGGGKGLLAITAPAGFGKSALAAYWCETAKEMPKRHIARHFCSFSSGPATISPDHIHAHLHQQVANAFGCSMDEPLIDLLKSAPPDDKQLVVWIDGIDEADDNDFIKFLPEELGDRVCLIVSARAEKDVTPAYLDPWLREDWADPHKRKHRLHLEKLSRDDVHRLVEELFDKAKVKVPPNLADGIFRASDEGYALFARIMTDNAIADIQKGQKPDLGKAPVSLQNYAKREFGRLGKLPEWRVLKPLFALLTIAKDAIPRDQAEILLGGTKFDRESFPDLFERWLNIVETSSWPLLSLAHPKLQEVFGRVLGPELGRAHNQLCDMFVPEFGDTFPHQLYTRWPSYALKHLPRHLLDAEHPTQAAKTLMDLKFVEARIAVFGAEAAPPLMAADWMAWYSIAGRKQAEHPADAMRHLRFWNNYAARLTIAAADGIDVAWRQLMHDVGLAPAVSHVGMTRPRPEILPMSLATLRGHKGPIRGGLALPDGAGFLSWSDDRTLRLWGPGGKQDAVLPGHKDRISGALALADGAGFLSWSMDNTLRIWEPNGELKTELLGHTKPVRGALILADSARILSWSEDHTLRLWGTNGEPGPVMRGHERPVEGALVLGNSEGFLSWSQDKTLWLWGPQGEPDAVLRGHEDGVKGALVLADSAGFLSWSWDDTLRLWKQGLVLPKAEDKAQSELTLVGGAGFLPRSLKNTLRPWRQDATLHGHEEDVKGALALADGTGFLSWSFKTLCFWDSSGELRVMRRGQDQQVNGALALADCAGFLSWGDNILRLWGPRGEQGAVLRGHEEWIAGALALADGAGFLSWSYDHTVRLWSLDGEPGAVLRGHEQPVHGALALADGAGFLTWSEDHTLRLWGLGSEMGEVLRGDETRVKGALALADGAGFLSWNGDKTLRLWGPDREPGLVLRGHEGAVNGALLLANGTGFLSWGEDMTLRTWAPDGKAVKVIRVHKTLIKGALALADGVRLLSWGVGKAEIWGPNGEAVAVLRSDTDLFEGVLELADGAGFLSWDALETTLRLWGPDGEPGVVLRGHESTVDGAVALVNGTGFLSWSSDRTLRVWEPNGRSGKILCVHRGHLTGALALADGTGFLTWGGNTLQLWGPGGEPGQVMRGHQGRIIGARILARDSGFLSWAADGRLSLWNKHGDLKSSWLSPAGEISHVEPFGEGARYLVVSGGHVGIAHFALPL